MNTLSDSRLLSLGRSFFAVALVAFGTLHFVHGGFVTRTVPSWPAWIPGTTVWVYAIGAALIAAGGALLAGFRARTVATVVGVLLFASAALLHLPPALANPKWGGLWTNLGKALALGGGAFAIAATFRAPTGASRPWQVLVGRIALGLFLILCGVQHFLYAGFVVQLVPHWIPGATFWTYFSAVALLAAGLGFVLGLQVRLDGLLTGGMIFVWLLVLHAPRALANLRDANETTAVFEALAMSGIALLLAATAGEKASDRSA